MMSVGETTISSWWQNPDAFKLDISMQKKEVSLLISVPQSPMTFAGSGRFGFWVDLGVWGSSPTKGFCFIETLRFKLFKLTLPPFQFLTEIGKRG